MIIYLDDILLISSSIEELKSFIDDVLKLIQSLGFIVDRDKSVTHPTQKIGFLGLIVNTLEFSFSLPEDKLAAIMKKCREALRNKEIRTRTLRSLLGSFVWTANSISNAQAHYRRLQHSCINALHSGYETVTLNIHCLQELFWWTRHVRVANGRAIRTLETDVEIYSDASLSGWGAVCDGVVANGPWTVENAQDHINELEMRAALYALRSFLV